MSIKYTTCPKCQTIIEDFLNPGPTVDIIIYEPELGVVLIKRKNIPFGYAIPGGFIDYGEFAEHAAVREALEETSLKVVLTGLLGVYSKPDRDPRSHTMSTIYIAKALNLGELKGADDAVEAAFYPLDKLPELVFDHDKVLHDFISVLQGQRAMGALSYPSPELW